MLALLEYHWKCALVQVFKLIISAFSKSKKNGTISLCPDSNEYSSVEIHTVRLGKLNSGSMLEHYRHFRCLISKQDGISVV